MDVGRSARLRSTLNEKSRRRNSTAASPRFFHRSLTFSFHPRIFLDLSSAFSSSFRPPRRLFLPHHSFIFLFPFLLPFFTENSIARFCFLLSPSFAHSPFQEEDRRAYVGQLPVLSPSLSRMLLWTFLSLSLLPLFSHPFSFSPRFNGCTRVRSPRLQEASSGSD